MKQYLRNIILKITPERLKKIFLNNIEKYKHLETGFAQITYSQQGEDIEIERLFRAKREGFYVDIGAFHPIKYSNTYKLYKNDWRGINIEPNPDQIAEFELYRKGDINLNIAISNNKSALKYYKFNYAAVNTFVEQNASSWANVDGFKIIDVKEIFTESLSNVLEKYLPPNSKIDLMNIDVEGMDIEVLKSNNWKKFRPYIILIEDVWQNKASLNDNDIYQFLYANNYSLISIIGITMFFIDNSQKEKVYN